MKEMFQIVFSIVFELYKENKSVNRKEVEKLTDISRSDATSILEEFLDR
jgi:predicted HTH transcriptional regulator